ncbi:hypothetical protein ACZ87_02953, partial [Candidatus Erwinia dacicola]
MKKSNYQACLILMIRKLNQPFWGFLTVSWALLQRSGDGKLMPL